VHWKRSYEFYFYKKKVWNLSCDIVYGNPEYEDCLLSNDLFFKEIEIRNLKENKKKNN